MSTSSINDADISWFAREQLSGPDITLQIPARLVLSRIWGNYSEKKWKVILFNTSLYLGEMVLVTLAIPYRIARVIGRIILLLIEICFAIKNGFDEEALESLKSRSICLGISFLRLISTPLFIICPPIGYKMEFAFYNLLPPDDGGFYCVVFNQYTENKENALAYFNLDEDLVSKSLVKHIYKAKVFDTHPDRVPAKDEEITFAGLSTHYNFLISDPNIPENATDEMIRNAKRQLNFNEEEALTKEMVEEAYAKIKDEPDSKRALNTAKELLLHELFIISPEFRNANVVSDKEAPKPTSKIEEVD